MVLEFFMACLCDTYIGHPPVLGLIKLGIIWTFLALNIQNGELILAQDILNRTPQTLAGIINLNNVDKTINPINFVGIFDGHGGKLVSKYLKTNIYSKF